MSGDPTKSTKAVIFAICAMMLTTALFLAVLLLSSGSATGAEVDPLPEQRPTGFSRENPALLPRQAPTETPPADTSMRLTVPSKSVVSLQTCTLPDYAKRLVVQAESVADDPSGGFGLPPAG